MILPVLASEYASGFSIDFLAPHLDQALGAAA